MKIFSLLGATCTGKTNLALKLVQYAKDKYNIQLHIISLDSALVYKHMNIGTAKPSNKELAQAPHYLIDIIEPTDTYNVGNFLQDVEDIINKISQLNNSSTKNIQHLPLIVGGTMLYYHSLINGIDNIPTQNIAIREKINAELQQHGQEYLYNKLTSIDPHLNIHPNDSQRIQRALEIYYISGQAPSKFYTQGKNNIKNHIFHSVELHIERKKLHSRIEQRFISMLEQNFINEVKQLLQLYPELNQQTSSMRCVGYRQALQYLTKQINYEQFVQSGIAATRQLAKRQITWLKKIPLNTSIDSNKPECIKLLQNEFDIYYHQSC